MVANGQAFSKQLEDDTQHEKRNDLSFGYPRTKIREI